MAVTPLLTPWDKCAKALWRTSPAQNPLKICDTAEFRVLKGSILSAAGTCSCVSQDSDIALDLLDKKWLLIIWLMLYRGGGLHLSVLGGPLVQLQLGNE